jgi:hypothetical protein
MSKIYRGLKNCDLEDYEVRGISEWVSKHLPRYGLVAAGSCRAVFQKNLGTVIKVPFNERGIESNLIEAWAAKRQGEGRAPFPLADCKIVKIGRKICLEMEELSPVEWASFAGIPVLHCKDQQRVVDYPEWAKEMEDGPQVGLDANGVVKAFDYAEDFHDTERENFVRWQLAALKRNKIPKGKNAL